MTEITETDIREALDRIARTPDGELLYRYLQKELMGVTSSDEDRVLRTNHGRRSFARDLMAHMGEGVSNSARSGPVTFSIASRVAASRRTPGGRLVSADTPVPGADTAYDPDPAR